TPQEVDFLDPESRDGHAELRGLRRRITGSYPVKLPLRPHAFATVEPLTQRTGRTDRADEIDIAAYALRKLLRDTDSVELSPERQCLPADQQRIRLGRLQNLPDLLRRKRKLRKRRHLLPCRSNPRAEELLSGHLIFAPCRSSDFSKYKDRCGTWPLRTSAWSLAWASRFMSQNCAAEIEITSNW